MKEWVGGRVICGIQGVGNGGQEVVLWVGRDGRALAFI